MSKLVRVLRIRPDVVPVLFFTCLGASLAATAIIRTAIKCPEVSLDRKNNPHPWLKVKPTQQSKFIHAYDYSHLKDERPKYEDKE